LRVLNLKLENEFKIYVFTSVILFTGCYGIQII
jgi:hypothetical protein